MTLASLLVASAPGSSWALDKQGSAHGGKVAGAESGFAVTGSLLAGVAIYNPTYAARPDNSGLALGRLAPHIDVDVIGSRLSIPIDVNLFTDRQRSGFNKVVPSELDVISGLTSTWPIGPTALELGARFERDMPVDRGGRTQSYSDMRARWLGSLAAAQPGAADWFGGGDLTGYLALGWFDYNPTYAARPDNTGFALLRYVAHSGMTLWDGYLSISLDATMFTDRQTNAVRPSELDFTGSVGTHLAVFDFTLAYERDMPVDRAGLVQHFLMGYATWGFELVHNPTMH